MFLNYIILSISASIDAIGIGLSYGMRKTNINNFAKLIISIILYIATFLGVTVGNILSLFFTDNILKLLGSIILICIGTFIIYENSHFENGKETNNIFSKTKRIMKDSVNADIDNSKTIDWKEAIYLAISVSVDAFSMGVYASIDSVNVWLFPLCMTIIHVSFLFLGKFFGKHIVNISKVSENIWKIFSGILLIFIGCVKYIF